MNTARPVRWLSLVCLAAFAGFCTARAAELDRLKTLYIGEPGTKRSTEFESFLKVNVAQVTVTNRFGFKPQNAEGFDVVLLDWPQSGREGDFPPKVSPLGNREAWTKPTVLLGSAGLNLAVTWKGKGGSG